jgi:threonine efflux protein
MFFMTDALYFLSAFFLPYALVLVVPGPNLLVVSSAGFRSARAAVQAAIGVACGACLAAGIAAETARSIPDLPALRVLGTLLFCGFMLHTSVGLLAPRRLPARQEPDRPAKEGGTSFLLGLGAAALNPLSVPFYLSLFLSHPDFQRPALAAVVCLTIFAMSGAWFSLVGLVVSRSTGAIETHAALRPVRCAVAFAIVVVALRAGSRVVMG